ncbi:glycoside hydrolase family 5 protein [Thermothelomyces thermophilus ATCC 42464]|uniref:Glycoside hydrolase family 5 protein n=1 Tax=Thermothelomyces thermophilus (strain ATCC 42464 / BCRC 31852 / DSM 1799) TaxID=573729 RepID=G2QG55_THET4|nr:glycoside hydrolase family 5 protein [Thermothelomyces thermophilus ATCC 42464]AEO58520.1 glycoside hydrolase family 5 protein [Thermothelomyces thermophilus ATCC 42464]
MKPILGVGALLNLGATVKGLVSSRADWPNGPLVTSGRWIHDASGNNVTYAGTNWPGHTDVMIPEGLQYQSIETIVQKVKSLGMNAVRLTFAIQMIDEIYANNGKDITLERAFVQALGQTNGIKVLNQVLANNPQFNTSTTRLQVFDAVAAELNKQQIYIHLDNHISKGMWCCSSTDGNSWWGDTYFSTENWVRGLSYMAEHGKSWPALTSIGLRNEPREPTSNPALAQSSYNWQSWYRYMRQGADAVHGANPDLLIFLSGLNFDTYLTPVVRGEPLAPGTDRFDVADFAAGPAGKLVLELHNYETGATSCDALRANLDRNGFEALLSPDDAVANVLPVVMTEFGFQMDDRTWRGVYASCLAQYLPERKAGWTIWVLAGSYYVRSGTQDYDEGWGLLNHDWSDWRSPGYVDGALKAMVRETLS